MTKILTHLFEDDFDMLELDLIQVFGFVPTQTLLQLINLLVGKPKQNDCEYFPKIHTQPQKSQ